MGQSRSSDSRIAEIDRNAMLNYQASYLADRFAMPLSEARSFVEEFGVSRRELNRAVQERLLQSRPF